MTYGAIMLGLLIALPALAAPLPPESPLFRCGDQAVWEEYTDCLDARVQVLNETHASPARYDAAAGKYFYDRLSALPAGAAEKETSAQYDLRGRIGEWLYFSTPEWAAESESPPTSYQRVSPLSMTEFAYYPLRDGDMMIVYWLYNAAYQSAYQAAIWHADGSISPMQVESFEDGKLTTQPAYFNNVEFDPKTGRASDSSRSGWTWYESDYLLEGNLFRLQKLVALESEGDAIASKETVLYPKEKTR
ncbi:MAG: hypothetical protein DI582_00215 [Azospirillum brasilense]|nr:MAG: hypothetical protein DI582_00215 [Azospirillum brasilense]